MTAKFRCVLADPPWQYGDRGARKRGATDRHYRTMPLKEILALGERCGSLELANTFDLLARKGDSAFKAKDILRLAGHDVSDDAWLWLWTTSAFLADGSATSVATAWGFRPITILTWVKQTMTQARAGAPLRDAAGKPLVDFDVALKVQTGHYLRNVTEHVLVAVRGDALALRLRADLPTCFYAPVPRTHSRKPAESYRIIESMCPGPRLELFARRRFSEEWTTWGDEAPGCPKQTHPLETP